MAGAENTQDAAPTGLRALLVAWTPTLLFIALILVMATQPSPALPRVRQIDKYVHATVYGVLALLARRSLARTGVKNASSISVLMACAVGAADEGLQALGRVRIADRYDLLADVLGALLAILAVRVFQNRRDGIA